MSVQVGGEEEGRGMCGITRLRWSENGRRLWVGLENGRASEGSERKVVCVRMT